MCSDAGCCLPFLRASGRSETDVETSLSIRDRTRSLSSGIGTIARRGSVLFLGSTIEEPPPSHCSLFSKLTKNSNSEQDVRLLRELTVRSADPKAVACEAVVLVLVGLPARGKSYISGAVVRHLKLLGVRARIFNSGELRREAGNQGATADFFSASNTAAKDERERLTMSCLDSLLDWLNAAPPATSSVGLLDATNTTKVRRANVLQHCRGRAERNAQSQAEKAPLRVVFLESLCDDPHLLQGNYKMKLRNDDYKGAADANAALDDFRKRVEAYENQYEPLEDQELNCEGDVSMPVGCVRIFNGGEKIHCCRTSSSLVAEPVISLLHAMHLTPRRILIAPEALESGNAVDPHVIAEFLQGQEAAQGQPIDVICGTSLSGATMAQQLGELMSERPQDYWEHDVSGGLYDSPAVASRQQPRAILTLRALSSRSTQGGSPESYADLVRRMAKEVILLIERLPRSVLVICPGDDVRRVLVAHFQGVTRSRIEDVRVPDGQVIQLTRDHKGFSADEVDLPLKRGVS